MTCRFQVSSAVCCLLWCMCSYIISIVMYKNASWDVPGWNEDEPHSLGTPGHGRYSMINDQWSMAIWWNLQIGEFWELGRILWIVKNRLPQSFAHQMAPSLSETIRCWKSKMMERYGMCKMSPQQWIWSSWFLWCSHISPFVPGCKFPTLVRWDRTSMRKRSCVGAWYKIIWKPWSQTDRPVFLMDGWGSNSWPEKLHNLD